MLSPDRQICYSVPIPVKNNAHPMSNKPATPASATMEVDLMNSPIAIAQMVTPIAPSSVSKIILQYCRIAVGINPLVGEPSIREQVQDVHYDQDKYQIAQGSLSLFVRVRCLVVRCR